MNILHIINNLEIGGAQKLLVDLLPTIGKTQKVDLLVFQDKDNEFTTKIKAEGIHITSLHTKHIYNPFLSIRLRSIIRSYDIIHVHLFPSSYWSAIASLGCKLKLVYTEHSTSNKRRNLWFLRPIEKFIYGRYSKTICISEETQKSLVQWINTSDVSNFPVIYNGIDLANFRHKKTDISYSNRGRNIIMVSRFVQSKDQDTVIRSLKYLPDDINLLLVGDGERRHTCQMLTKELGLSNRVVFLGNRTDIPQLLRSATIGIQSSHWEGFGLTAVEMMASGLPVIASDVPGLRQVVDGAGLLFKAGNEKDLAECINKLLSNPTLYKHTAKQGQERALYFDINLTAKRYLSLYNEVIKEK